MLKSRQFLIGPPQVRMLWIGEDDSDEVMDVAREYGVSKHTI